MQLTSTEFADQEPIPMPFTCDGEDLSPPLQWTDLPAGTGRLALTCEDPDAPGGTFVHWVAWGIDPRASGLEPGKVPPGTYQGRNGFGRIGYGGPCPPPGHGVHHYRFTLYALTTQIDLANGATIDELRAAIAGAVLDEAALVGTYERR